MEENKAWASHIQSLSNDLVEDNNVVIRQTNASWVQDGGGAQGRPGYNRNIYDHYRPSEAVPKGNSQHNLHEIMAACTAAYETVGVIRSTIDMMSEFGAEGIEIVHEDESVQNFYNNWQRLVNLEDRAERFLSWFFKSGNTVVRRKSGTLGKEASQKMKRALAAEKDFGSIPIGYIFYNPAHVNLVGGTIGALASKKAYSIKIPLTGFYELKKSKIQADKDVYNSLPDEIKKIIEKGNSNLQSLDVILPADKIFVAHYKKDDTDVWAKSFIYSILSDVYYNDKLKLAKTTALDGIINVIRLWKLGDHTITPALYPDGALTGKLAQILSNNVGGGSMDIIWNSAIELEEFYPPIEKLVNFKESYHQILLGLGVPESLVGGSEVKAGIGTNTIGLKNFIKRLEAGRRALREWLEGEIDVIQKAMGFRKRPYIRFAHSDLHDERTYYNLLIQLADRNIISQDRILELVNELPQIEKARIASEEAERKNGTRLEKAGPYHNPQLKAVQKHELNKINVTNESRNKGNEEKPNGRPNGSKDTFQRKRQNVNVRAPANLILHTNKIYDYMENYVNKQYLATNNINDIRKLTSNQREELEELKDNLFPLINPNIELSEEAMVQAIKTCDGPIDDFNVLYKEFVGEIGSPKLSFADRKILKVNAYLQAWGIN